MNILSYPKFIRPVISFFLCIISIFLSLGDKPIIPHGKEINMSKFELTWADEFDGDNLDLSKWGAHCFNNGETAVRRGGYWDLKLATVADGNLHIATKFYPEGLDGNGKPGWYTCGIDTKKAFEQKHGYFEVRCILPKGVGQWSAFWMLCDSMSLTENGGKDGAEIDIFESCFYSKEGVARNSVSSNIHINGYGDAHEAENVCDALVTANNPYEEFNTYGLEWNEDGYIFYINGVETGRSSFGGVSEVPEWLILSVEVDGADGVPADGWSGPSIENNTEPLTDFVVDYVRAYQYK